MTENNEENFIKKEDEVGKAIVEETHEPKQEEDMSREGSGVDNVRRHHSDEEVAQKLFQVPEVPPQLTSFWNWGKSVATDVEARVKKGTEDLKHKVDDLHLEKNLQEVSGRFETMDLNKLKSFGDNLYQNVNKTLHEVNENISKTLEKGRSTKEAKEERVPFPWEPETKFSSEMKSRIFALSQDSSTFLIPPHEESEVPQMEVKIKERLGKQLLEEDPQLQRKRLELVPRQIDDETFWNNYFYRVSMIKKSYGITNVSNSSMRTESINENEPTDDKSQDWEDELRKEIESDNDENYEMFDDDELLAAVHDEDEDEPHKE